MPNRFLKESICTSENIDALDPFEECFFYRLIVNCDDFGRFDGRPKVLSAKLFPLKDISTEQVEMALSSLESADLITRYRVDGKPYIQVNTWMRHQNKRATKSKWPDPADNCEQKNSVCVRSISDESKCKTSDNKCYQAETVESNCARTRISLLDTRISKNDEEEDTRARVETPFGEIPVDPIIVKVQKELLGLTDTHYSLLEQYRQTLGDDLVSYAIDQAVANGSRKWSYVEKILINYDQSGIKSVGEAKSAEGKYRSERRTKPDGNHRGNLRQDGLRDAQRALREQYADRLGTI